ncbi:MAG TPA: hypothetical protein VKP69_09020, partial [Isosphaeraceae bacterium]|nr:hypothetical protein [Isosphaeraceae bacterium]
EAILQPGGDPPGPGRRLCLRGPGPVPTDLWFRDDAALLHRSIEANVARAVAKAVSGLAPLPGDGPCSGRESPPAEVKPAEPAGLEHELVVRGVTASAARELVATYAEDRIRAQLERFDWLRAKKPRKVTDPGGYLTDAIRRDYAAPAGFVSRAAHGQAEQGRRQREAEDRRAKARRQEDQARIDAYWQALALEQQARLEAEAVEQADPAVRARCEAGTPRMRAMARRVIREAHIRDLLDPPVVG